MSVIELVRGEFVLHPQAVPFEQGASPWPALSFVAGCAVPKAFAASRRLCQRVRWAWFASRPHHRYGHCCRSDLVLKRDAFSIGFSMTHRSPVWMSMIISGSSCTPHGERSANPFQVDPEVAREAQASPHTFRNSDYDRGHLAPRETCSFSPEAERQTFLMTNVVAQNAELNRNGWARLEKQVRVWAEAHGRLAVAAGPVFSDDRRLHGVAIPSAFFMAVVDLSRPGHAIGFLVPNSPAGISDIRGGAMSVHELEARTGLRLFRHAPLWVRIWSWKRRRCDLRHWHF